MPEPVASEPPSPRPATFEEPSEEFDEPLAMPRPDTPYRLPDASSLVISTPQLRSATGEERVATQLLEALGHHGIEARLVGTVAGPRVTRYEIQLAPGTKVGKVEALRRRTSRTRSRRRRSASWRRSPASRRSASRCRT